MVGTFKLIANDKDITRNIQDELINAYPELDFSDIAKGLKEALMKAKIGSLITLKDDE